MVVVLVLVLVLLMVLVLVLMLVLVSAQVQVLVGVRGFEMVAAQGRAVAWRGEREAAPSQVPKHDQ